MKIWTMMATTLSRRIPPLRKGTRIAFSRTGEEEAVLQTSNTLVIQTEMMVRTTAARIAQISISKASSAALNPLNQPQ
jgi:hypothetical protein